MQFSNEKNKPKERPIYSEPKVILLSVENTDIITESHTDPYMGEWDTE